MKKKFAIIGFITLFILVAVGRFYKKYNRQKVRDQQLNEQRSKALEFQKAYEVKEQKRLDSIERAKPTRLDSVKAEINEKQKKMKALMKKLEKEAKEKK